MIEIIDNIILVGTSHVSEKSAKEIEEVIEKYKPKIVGIELDSNRLKSLLSEDKFAGKKRRKSLIKEIGFSGYLFAMIAGFVQDKVGKNLNIEPGVDMKTAYLKAKEKEIDTALIDIDIRLTLRKFSKLSFSRKFRIFSSLFFKGFKKEYRDKLTFDVKKGVPDDKVIFEMLRILKKEVPDLYNILIEDRNIYMSKRLLEFRDRILGDDVYIIGVVGAGHLMGMKEYILKNMKDRKSIDENTINFSYSLI